MADVHLHILTSTCSDEELRSILAFSCFVFDTPEETVPQASLDKWRSTIKSDLRSFIIYASRSSSPYTSWSRSAPTSIQQHEDEPLGFFFVCPRVQPELGGATESLHIWLAAVRPSARGLGIFNKLLEKTKQNARDMEDGQVKWLTVCTIPKRFTRMYSILKSNEWEECSARDGGKVIFKLKI